jgi:hypothetical protein
MEALVGAMESDEVAEDENGEATAEAHNRLLPLFAGTTVRDAFLKAQTLLPAEHRYRRVASIKTPYGADVYVEPESKDGDVDLDDDE